MPKSVNVGEDLIYDVMKRFLGTRRGLVRGACVMFMFLIAGSTGVLAQEKALERATNKMYKAKMKEYKREGWKLAGSSRTLDVALLEHYKRLREEGNTELVGEVSQARSLNAAKQAAYNNALITYANLAGSTLRGRVTSDLQVDQSAGDGEFDKMYAAYERLVQAEIKGVLTESYAIVREDRRGNKEYKVFFIVNEEKASAARLRAMERAMEETKAAQRYAREIADFVREGFEGETGDDAGGGDE